MKIGEVMDALVGVNLMGLRLALRDRESARAYLSTSIRNYNEMMGQGLPGKDPISFIIERGWGAFSPDDRVELPTRLHDGGGTRLDELLYLATAARVLRPRKVFEIGTFSGRTTAAFILNSPPGTEVVTLDLPPDDTLDAGEQKDYIDTDVNLVRGRKLASFIHDLRLGDRCRQVWCDSLQFDPSPHLGTVELGFIDGAHSLPYVKNDTEKMARMVSERGIVFWHDYGGKGRFRPLTEYLESLAGEFSLFRVPNTTLAWAAAPDLRRLAAKLGEGGG
jgi:hypothetical protein